MGSSREKYYVAFVITVCTLDIIDDLAAFRVGLRVIAVTKSIRLPKVRDISLVRG